jgi:hypothetical protein
LMEAYANAIVVQTPVQASWLNQGEISFALVQRNVLPPHDFASLAAVAQRRRLYEAWCNQRPRPFQWKFTREKRSQFLARLKARRAAQSQTQAALENSKQVA